MSLLTDVERARHEGRATAAATTGPTDRAPEEHVVIDPSILYLGTPVLLISATSADGCANLALISSSWLLGTVGVPGTGTRSPGIENLRRSGEAALSVPSVELVDPGDRLAATTGSSPLPAYKEAMGFESVTDKSARAGLTEQPSQSSNTCTSSVGPVPDSPNSGGNHECLFHPWEVAFARSQAANVHAQAPLVRACVLCGMWVDLVAVALERLVDQRAHP